MHPFLQRFVFKLEPLHYLYPYRDSVVAWETIADFDSASSRSSCWCFDRNYVYDWCCCLPEIVDKRRLQRMTSVVSNHFKNSKRAKPKNHYIWTPSLHYLYIRVDFVTNQQTRHFSSMVSHLTQHTSSSLGCQKLFVALNRHLSSADSHCACQNCYFYTNIWIRAPLVAS